MEKAAGPLQAKFPQVAAKADARRQAKAPPQVAFRLAERCRHRLKYHGLVESAHHMAIDQEKNAPIPALTILPLVRSGWNLPRNKASQ